MSKCAIGILAAIAICSPIYAEVHKWVDENGKVHYGDQPPPSAKSVEVSKVTPNMVDSVGAKITPDQRAELASREVADGLRNAKESKSDDNFDCNEAVSNANEWLDSMRDVGRANVKSGHMAEAEFEKGRAEIEQLRKKLSVSECNASAGNVRQFYKCASNLNNHLAMCASRYGYK